MKRLIVDNFKSIKKLDLKILPFMVLVGPNGAGKTNIVQALSLFLDILAWGTVERIEAHGGYEQLIRRSGKGARSMRLALERRVNALGPTPGNKFAPMNVPIGQFLLKFELTLKFDRSEGVSIAREVAELVENDGTSLRLEWDRVSGLRTNRDNESPIWKWWNSHFIDMLSDDNVFRPLVNDDRVRLKFYWFLNRVLFPPVFPSMVHLRLDSSALRQERGGELLPNRLFGSAGEGLPQAVLRMKRTPYESFSRVLRKLQSIYPRIEDISAAEFVPGRIALTFKEKNIHGKLGVANVSDGVMHALALLIALEESDPRSTLAIEEPENALHPWALREIISDSQNLLSAKPLILTTQSPVVIDAVQDPRSLFIVENQGKQGTTVTPAIQKEAALSAILAESGMKLGEVWLGGMLGGVPGAGQ